MGNKSKTVMKKATISFLILAFLTGCATSPDKISATYVSPVQYQGYTCNQIEQELARVERKVFEVSGKQKGEADKDAAAMAIGLILFWPALFFLAGEDRKDELARLKGEIEALECIAIQKECNIATALQKKSSKENVEKSLASIPKEVTDDKGYKAKLRHIPKELLGSDVKEMVEEYNFFVKDLNEEGNFSNDFVDNGDGTITDRSTELMWQKKGSSSELNYSQAKKYVAQLNEVNYLAYNDWRIPTLEELCSLLECKVNKRGQHISSLFEGTQSKCWSEDHFKGLAGSAIALHHHIVNFTNGKTDEVIIEDIHDGDGIAQTLPHFVRTVRTIK